MSGEQRRTYSEPPGVQELSQAAQCLRGIAGPVHEQHCGRVRSLQLECLGAKQDAGGATRPGGVFALDTADIPGTPCSDTADHDCERDECGDQHRAKGGR